MGKYVGKKILVIPDAHARPEQENSRFTALGNFIVEKQPDIVVCIGDWAEMGSLCAMDKGQRASEGRRYQDDIEAARDALNKTMRIVTQGYKKRKQAKPPQFHITLGNHENRIIRATNLQPEMYGKLSIDDLGFKEHNWLVHDFLTPIVIEDICFQHYFTAGILGKPIGGVTVARTLLSKHHQSCVQGHSHQRAFHEDVRADGHRLFGLVVGCYTEGAFVYTTEQRLWWSGLVILHEARDGTAEPAFYSLPYVKAKYL